MAKLEGVKVIDMVDGEVTKVSFEGGVYELTFEQAQVGDVLFNINEGTSRRANTYYKVVEVDGYARVSDENGEAHGWANDLQGDYFKIYRRALKPIDRKHVKVGDRIRITNPHPFSAGDDYDKGDIMVVKEVDCDGYVTETDKYEGIILRSEFEIVGEANVTFRKIDERDAKVGDYLMIRDDEDLPSYLKHGKKYEIISFDVFGDAYINDEDGDEYDTCRMDFDVFEKVSNIEVGDTVKIKYGGERGSLHGFKDGDLCTVEGIGQGEYYTHTVVSDDGVRGYATLKQLEKVDATPTPSSTPAPKLKEGDKVRISIPEHEETRHNRAGVTNDEIGTVESVRDNVFGEPGVAVNFPSYGEGWSGIADELELVEIEVGDTVRLNIKCGDTPHCGWGRVSNGDVGTVRSEYSDMIDVDFPSQSEWSGKRHEFELVSKAGNESEAVDEEVTKSDVKAGGIYVTTGETRFNDIPVGTTVKVTDTEDVRDFVRIEFMDGSDFDRIDPKYLENPKIKEGDIVRLDEGAGPFSKGTIGEITSDCTDGAPELTAYVQGDKRTWYTVDAKMTLIAYKEDRQDD